MRPREVLTSNKGEREIVRERKKEREGERDRREGESLRGREGEWERGIHEDRVSGREVRASSEAAPRIAERTTDWRQTIGAGSIVEFSKEDVGAAS